MLLDEPVEEPRPAPAPDPPPVRRARRQRPEPPANHERWLVSYADFVTLLFAFFVTMYAISRVDAAKLSAMVDSMQTAFQADVTGAPSKTKAVKPAATPPPPAFKEPSPPTLKEEQHAPRGEQGGLKELRARLAALESSGEGRPPRRGAL